jgi:hypothetical protein
MMKDQGDDVDRNLKVFQPGASSQQLDQSLNVNFEEIAKGNKTIQSS